MIGVCIVPIFLAVTTNFAAPNNQISKYCNDLGTTKTYPMILLEFWVAFSRVQLWSMAVYSPLPQHLLMPLTTALLMTIIRTTMVTGMMDCLPKNDQNHANYMKCDKKSM